jgi:hypothetical protein
MWTLRSLNDWPRNQKRPPEGTAVKEGVKHDAYLRAGGLHRASLSDAAIYIYATKWPGERLEY